MVSVLVIFEYKFRDFVVIVVGICVGILVVIIVLIVII